MGFLIRVDIDYFPSSLFSNLNVSSGFQFQTMLTSPINLAKKDPKLLLPRTCTITRQEKAPDSRAFMFFQAGKDQNSGIPGMYFIKIYTRNATLNFDT